MNYYLDVLRNKYAQFDGRARRQEYWTFMLFNLLIAIAIWVVELVLGTDGFFGILYSLAVLVPGVALAIRRLHDTNRSGWWMLIALIPFIGGIILLIFAIMDGTPGTNAYGPNPKEATGATPATPPPAPTSTV